MAARITAVNIVYEILPDPFGEISVTAIDKRPVGGRVEVDALGLAGDTQCDTRNHGGRDQALYAYADEDADWWAEQLGRVISPGLFGENLRTSGLEVTGAEIGERWRIGDGSGALVVEVTMPRIPCQTFAHRMGEAQWVKQFTQHGAPGAYLRVVSPGSVAAGGPVVVHHRPGHGVTVGDAFLGADPAVMRRLLAAAGTGAFEIAPDLETAAARVAARSTVRWGLPPGCAPDATRRHPTPLPWTRPMPSTPPEGEPVPPDGALPAGAADGARRRAFGIYLHVPFCATRCGYCDFNTYTPSELAGDGARVDPRRYAASVLGELDLAAGVIRAAGLPERPASTVFIGGGTPTLLPASDLGLMLAAVRDRFGLAAGAEVTAEANPDSVTAGSLAALAEHGVTRVSLGMQSAVGHVLATLDRTHDVQRVPQAVAWARAAGLSVSLDLIYGTPGETLGDWRRSLDAALACGPDHVSAYALVVEPGTRLAARVRRGELPGTDEDDLADKYELADTVLAAAGYHWYEVSNWARTPRDVCRHNLGYWRGDDWWGAGPGAHSHVGGVRWWNVRHPADYAARVSAGRSPAQARERLDAGQRHTEQVLLGLRLAEGLPLACLTEAERARLPALAERGLLGAGALPAGRAVLTLTGRLLADGVVRDVLD